MPFMGKDWRSPGEAWVKTESLGWQRMKLIESQLSHSHLCNQANNATACSWPPKCDYGQHMVYNCSTSKKPPQQMSIIQPNIIMLGNSADSRDSIASPGSSDSGRGNSVSPSPSCSPEKLPNHHDDFNDHLFPLAFSSPYGSYSLIRGACNHNGARGGSTSTQAINQTGNSSTNEPRIAQQIQPNQLANMKTNPNKQDRKKTINRFTNNVEESTNAQVERNTIKSQSSYCSSKFSIDADDNEKTTGSQTNAKCDIRMLSSINHDNNSKNSDKCGTFQHEKLSKISLNDEHRASELIANSSSNNNKENILQLRPSNTTSNLMNESTNNGRDTLRANSDTISTNSQLTPSSLHDNDQHRVKKNNEQTTHSHSPTRNAPFCPISIRTREVAIYNTISEAFYRLDFCNAVHDIRRFNYVCKLLHLMITQNLTSLSGCATKVLFNMLEQIAREVSTNKRNIHVLKDLLDELKMMIQKYSCWGRPIGSSQLWQQHFDTIERISSMIDSIELGPSALDSQGISFNELPAEMIREIILRLNDYRDLINSAKASPVMKEMIVSQNIWERMCRYHFSEQQLKMVLDSYKRTPSNRRPKSKYIRTDSSELRKQPKKDGAAKIRPPKDHSSAASSAETVRSSTNTNSQIKPEDCSSKLSSQSSCSSSSEEESRLLDKTHTKKTPSYALKLNGQLISSSYVNRTRKIFDQQENFEPQKSQPTTNQRATGSAINKKTHRSGDSIKRFKHNNNSNDKDKTDDVKLKTPSTETNTGQLVKERQHRQNTVEPLNEPSRKQELDWEDVFHQLRKRFDLKEEYADCLLLCRHCRCLFWKSIGHPCIEGTDLDSSRLFQALSDPDLSSRAALSSASRPSSSNNGRNGRGNRSQPAAEDRRDRRFSTGRSGVGEQASSGNLNNRLSVAALSRNFDNRSRDANHLDRPVARAGLADQVSSNDNNRLREVRPDGNNQNRLAGNNRNNANSVRPSRLCGEDLVPKHVTISPQAFLKFFSL